MSIPISIIVPVYQAESTLERCVRSILNQTFQDFELLLIDDGSTDASPRLCDRFAAEDHRIFVIHKENTGVSDSRNIGIQNARGTYLQFVDSDDWLSPDASALLYHAATKHGCDMVIADFYRVVKRRVSHKGNIPDERVLSRIEFAERMMEKPADFYYGVLWNKLFRRGIIEKYALRMDVTIDWCEDFMFNLEYIRHAETFYALHTPIYYYVRTKGSLASQGMSLPRTISMKKTVFAHYHKFYREIFPEEEYEKNRLQVYRFLVDAARDGSVPLSARRKAIWAEEEPPRFIFADISLQGVLADDYLERKLFERYLEPIAAQSGLKVDDIRILTILCQSEQMFTKKELADFLNLPVSALTRGIQRLISRNYIRTEDVRLSSSKDAAYSFDDYMGRRKNALRAFVLPAAVPVIQEILSAQQDYEKQKFKDFSEEEIRQYRNLERKMKGNVKDCLKIPC